MADLPDFHRRAVQIRKIAKGIFDREERKTLLDFVADLEKLTAKPEKPTRVGR